MAKKGIFLIDDHTSFRKGIHSILDKESQFSIVGEAENGNDALKKIEILDGLIDVLLIDISLPDMSGIELVEILKSKGPGPLIMLLSMHSSEEYILKAITLGVNGYIVKENVSQNLLKGLTSLFSGESFYHPWFSSAEVISLRSISARSSKTLSLALTDLTSQEQAIFCLLAEDITFDEIAIKLNFDLDEVEKITIKIKQKLNLDDHTMLKSLAVRMGIVEADYQ